jgi:hypothetical protein
MVRHHPTSQFAVIPNVAYRPDDIHPRNTMPLAISSGVPMRPHLDVVGAEIAHPVTHLVAHIGVERDALS